METLSSYDAQKAASFDHGQESYNSSFLQGPTRYGKQYYKSFIKEANKQNH